MNEKKENLPIAGDLSPFERIRRTNAAGAAYWSSRDCAVVLGYSDYRNFEAVIGKARLACFNSGHRIEDHFVDVTEMVTIGSGAQRPIKTVLLSRYACYLIVQNADPSKEIVALGQTYFAVQTRRQELSGRPLCVRPNEMPRGSPRKSQGKSQGKLQGKFAAYWVSAVTP